MEETFNLTSNAFKVEFVKEPDVLYIKYAENEEIRVKNLALRRDFIQQSKAKS